MTNSSGSLAWDGSEAEFDFVTRSGCQSTADSSCSDGANWYIFSTSEHASPG